MSFDRPPSYQTVNHATGNVNPVDEEHRISTANSSSVTLVATSSLSADPQGLVRLSWHPEAPQQFDNADDSHRIPFGAPPGYRRAERPETNVQYSFSPSSPNTMLLIPSANSPNTRPKFHVSVGMNPVIPLSYVTTVRQGGTENGAFVGEFEMGFLGSTHSSLYEWVTFDRRDHVELPRALQIIKKTSDGKKTLKVENPWKKALKWTYHDQTFYWFYETRYSVDLRRVCYATAEMPQDKAKVYARFTPRTKRTDGIITMETLEVTPEGHDFLDQIFVSLLILERQRLTPDIRIAES